MSLSLSLSLCLSLSLSLFRSLSEGTEAFPATFNGLIFNFSVLIRFYSSAFFSSQVLIHFTEVISVLFYTVSHAAQC